MKYQFTVDSIDPETTHGKVLSQIRNGSRVLECGCATGYITKFLKEQLNCNVYIIEYEQAAYDIARQYAEGGICADLTKEGWTESFEGMQFDYILFMDVLEHLTNPEKTLQQATSLLKYDGTVLISLPNIAHNDILINLHRNTFNYSNVGLLDNTHVHFYGLNNLNALVRSADLEMVKLDKTYVKTGCSELFWEEECRIPSDLLPVLMNRTDGEVYQFVITARRNEYCKDCGINQIEETTGTTSNMPTTGILDIYRQYTHVLEVLEERSTALLQSEEKVHQHEIQKQLAEQDIKLLQKKLEDQAAQSDAELREAEQNIKLLQKELDDQAAQSDVAIHELEERCSALSRQYEECQNSLRASEIMVQGVKNNYNQLELVHNQILCSRGWRFLNKYYRVRDMLFPKDSAIREFLKKIAGLLFGQKENNSTTPLVIPAAPQADSDIFAVQTVDGFDLISKCSRIDILSVPHTAYIAKMLQGILLDAGLECHTHLSEPEQYEDIPYIMICPQNFKHFPPVYIAFQMEQTINPRWLTDEYMDILHHAYAVFDYSLENIKFFRKDPILASKLYYLPVDICENMVKEDYGSFEKKYDVLFYGAPFIERRQSYLKPIGEKFNLRVISEKFGPELYEEMNKAKIIINVHYYENALLETTRLYETLSVCDCLIISERSGDLHEEAGLEELVDFVAIGDVDAMMERIRYWLTHEEERKAKVESNRKLLETRANAAKFYLYRFLLANDRISFDQFYDAVGNYIRFDTDRICLSLPESTGRRAAFDADNVYGFGVFPGLRHRMGWIGCGMSYKFMLRKAMEQQMERILICEDDVYFPPDFQQRFDHVLEYIEENDDWSVFSGIMADIGRVKALKYAQDKDEEFIYLDKMISMVFNIYDRSIFEAISSWDNTNRDVQKNTIDRYLENRELRILATCPFLVGHKEDLHSTIWGQQNTIYTDLIANSSVKLQKLVDDFKNGQAES